MNGVEMHKLERKLEYLLRLTEVAKLNLTKDNRDVIMDSVIDVCDSIERDLGIYERGEAE